MRDYDRLIQDSRARYPLNAAGERECSEHGVVLKPADGMCSQCGERAQSERRQRDAERRRVEEVEAWFANSCAEIDGLGGLPDFKHARFNNQKWLASCNAKIVAPARAWDLRTWLSLFAPTGFGKTSAIVARLHEIYAATLSAAERGPVAVPPKFVYCSGPELAEAERLRSYENRHRLIAAAMDRPVLILDEVTRAPVDLTFALLERRERRCLTTVLCAGAPGREVAKIIGSNILRRLADPGRVLIDCFGGGTR